MHLHIIINTEISLTNGESRTLELLKKKYKDVEHEVYIYVQPIIGSWRADFVIIDTQYGISVLEVKDWSAMAIERVNISNVIVWGQSYQNPAKQVMRYADAIRYNISKLDVDDIDRSCVSQVIVFPNMTRAEAQCHSFAAMLKRDIIYVFKGGLSSLSVSELFSSEAIIIPNQVLTLIRGTLFPESLIVTKSHETSVTTLDAKQESFAKQVPEGHYMVTGIPGSGKTVVLMSRAIHLIQEHPDWRILIVTYNRALADKLKEMLNEYVEKIEDDETRHNLNHHHITVENFHRVVKRAIPTTLWPQKPDVVWWRTTSIEVAMQHAICCYDAVLVDEYQDFYKHWIEFCKELCIPKVRDKDQVELRNMFLVGDRLQGIYNEEDISWSSIGLNMQGRSKFLKTAYRSTHQQLALSLNYLRADSKLKKEVDKFYEAPTEELQALHDGQVVFHSMNVSELKAVILQFNRQGYKAEDILILGGTWPLVEKLVLVHPNMIIKYRAIENKETRGYIKATTIHQSKGLEAKVVILVNPDSVLGENEQKKRKLLYVAMTRASECLLICHVSGNDIVFNELKALSQN